MLCCLFTCCLLRLFACLKFMRSDPYFKPADYDWGTFSPFPRRRSSRFHSRALAWIIIHLAYRSWLLASFALFSHFLHIWSSRRRLLPSRLRLIENFLCNSLVRCRKSDLISCMLKGCLLANQTLSRLSLWMAVWARSPPSLFQAHQMLASIL